MSTKLKNQCVAYSAGALQAFIGLTAIAGGYNLITHPVGSPDMPVEWLRSSPFSTFYFPGLVLLCIGAGNVVSLGVTIASVRHRGWMTSLGGIIVIGYMLAEVWWIGWQNALQPLYLMLGLVLALAGLALKKPVGPPDAAAVM